MTNMEIPKSPFDAAVGGAENVSTMFALHKFAAPRMEEILMLSEALNDQPSKGLVFQRLPKHMRRRQMSHHQSRLPRRSRTDFPLKKCPATKRPSRKYRRKPSNLLAEYNRRKQKHMWLETHIWHAKRFHMVKNWGYKLAERPTNKSFRANYRAIRSHCLLVDVSFMATIELQGPEDNLIDGLKKCTNSECGLTFKALAFMDGSKEGNVTIFHPNSYPYRAIGKVSFLWQPENVNGARKLWICVHPAFYDEVISCFADVFNLELSSKENSLPTYKSELVQMTSLKDKLNRFKLVGPLSSCVLSDSLVTPNADSCRCKAEPKEIDLEEDPTPCKKTKFDNGPSENSSLSEKAEVFAGLKSRPPSLYPGGLILSLTVLDPRMCSPLQRRKSVYNNIEAGVEDWPSGLACSEIWDMTVRERVTKEKRSDWEINQIRSQWIVPGMQCPQHATKIPVLLIQQPGNEGFGAGWDVIIPSNWAAPFWRSFVLQGARAGGLRELRLMKLEMESLRTALQPDSPAGRSNEETWRMTLQERYFKLPPAKRPNYIKLGIYLPFSTPWKQLFNQDFCVIREIKFLLYLSNCLKFKRRISTDQFTDGLIAVSLNCNKGNPGKLARISLPKIEDFRSKNSIEEPVHDDLKKTQRKEIRKKNKELLKKWRRDRIRRKSGGDAKWREEDIELLKQSSKELMRENWLLDKPVENARSTIGFVAEGDFQHISGSGSALGYVTLTSLLNISEISIKLKRPPMVLVRNVDHTLYRRASLKIILD